MLLEVTKSQHQIIEMVFIAIKAAVALQLLMLTAMPAGINRDDEDKAIEEAKQRVEFFKKRLAITFGIILAILIIGSHWEYLSYNNLVVPAVTFIIVVTYAILSAIFKISRKQNLESIALLDNKKIFRHRIYNAIALLVIFYFEFLINLLINNGAIVIA